MLYGISANTRAWWDLDPGRALGYEPEDDAEHYAAAIEAEPAAPSDEVEAAHVGGPFVTEAFYRPALRRSEQALPATAHHPGVVPTSTGRATRVGREQRPRVVTSCS